MTSDADGNYTNAYTYGLDRISIDKLSPDSDAKTDPLFYLYDGRGSVSVATNSLGQVRDKYRYDPYGQVKHGGFWGSNATHYENFYGYNGEDYNRLSGLDYLRARYYEPESGRFLTRDSYLGDVMQPLTLNRYAYALNNPMMYTDPSGHWPGWLDKAASAVSSFASNVVDTVANTISKLKDYVRDRIADTNYFNPPDEGNKNGYTNKPVTVPKFPENPLEVSKKNTTNSNRVNSCFSQPQITTRNYSNEVVRKVMDTVKKSCEGTQFLGSQNYDYKEKVTQGTGSQTLGDVIKANPGSYKYDTSATGWYLTQQYYASWYYGSKAYERLDEGALSHNSYLMFKLDELRRSGKDLSKLTVDEVDELSFKNASFWNKADQVGMAVIGGVTAYSSYKSGGNMPSNSIQESSNYGTNGAGNPKLYRKMSVAEAEATLESGIQPAIRGADPTKWTSESLEKVKEFDNKIVKPGTEEVIVEFEMNPEYYKNMQETAVPQRGSKGNPNVKYHYEGLEINGPYKNYGITPEQIDIFNKNILNIKIIQ
ncbi:RHS repeat-associated core domain-containing protein [Clostridium fungisolvens]|uniref:RHS repeat-associated core domain-containing protein n=1 Tax=Clostridium fungisolvens TaxID=1604897 RepID=A0A6V8SNP4_9CLOT|nr:RHS repeat-associated core domain-containing protein [Clostridium fungisolvens]GFP78431.1 hypothetical protein bsdtw1_04655 [Clostridium fungisolvens]